jgi:site-specific DNA-methyltransferase (adenine-specific)
MLYNDDCFNVLPLIENKTIDLVVLDLPYGQTNCKWDTKIDLEKLWTELKRVAKDNTIFVFFTTTKFGVDLINSNHKWFRYDLIWEKNTTCGFLNAKKMPLRNFEMIYVFSNPTKKGKIYNPQMTKGDPYIRINNNIVNNVYGKKISSNKLNETGDRYPKSILRFNNNNNTTRIHPTEKPVELLEWIIKTYSNENNLILDCCMGSGSTIVGCINTNRNYIGIEMDTEIFEKAKDRIESIKL